MEAACPTRVRRVAIVTGSRRHARNGDERRGRLNHMRPFIIMLAAALVLAGCSGGGADGPASTVRGGNAAALPKQAPPADSGADRAESVRLAPAQAIIYSADLTVRAGDVARAAADARGITLAAGGYVGSENAVDDAGSHSSSTLVLKVPPARYQSVLDQLGSARIGRRVSLRQRSDDVTEQVADVASRVKSAQATLASFRKLLGRARDISDVVRLEQEISSRESDLESLQARQKSLGAQTAYATVTLRLEGPPAATPRHHKKASGFGRGASGGWHAFTAFVRGLGLVVGWLLPFLGLAALVGLPAWWLWRRRRSVPSGTA